jgi:hypothetical protein
MDIVSTKQRGPKTSKVQGSMSLYLVYFGTEPFGVLFNDALAAQRP